MSNITLYNGDCLVEMKKIPDKSVDLILCDLPYQKTGNTWDTIIPFDKLWKEYKRIITDTGVIALFGDNGIFTAKLICSNEKWFKYNWVFTRCHALGLTAKYQPLNKLESVSIFYNKAGAYTPQIEDGFEPYTRVKDGVKVNNGITNSIVIDNSKHKDKTTRFPTTLLDKKEFHCSNHNRLHPTQKAVPLLEYLIKTYTTEEMTVLDNTMGSGSTGVAAKNLNRDFIGIEMNKEYFDIAEKRIKEA